MGRGLPSNLVQSFHKLQPATQPRDEPADPMARLHKGLPNFTSQSLLSLSLLLFLPPPPPPLLFSYCSISSLITLLNSLLPHKRFHNAFQTSCTAPLSCSFSFSLSHSLLVRLSVSLYRYSSLCSSLTCTFCFLDFLLSPFSSSFLSSLQFCSLSNTHSYPLVSFSSL